MDISINVYNENKILFHDIIIYLQYANIFIRIFLKSQKNKYKVDKNIKNTLLI